MVTVTRAVASPENSEYLNTIQNHTPSVRSGLGGQVFSCKNPWWDILKSRTQDSFSRGGTPWGTASCLDPCPHLPMKHQWLPHRSLKCPSGCSTAPPLKNTVIDWAKMFTLIKDKHGKLATLQSAWPVIMTNNPLPVTRTFQTQMKIWWWQQSAFLPRDLCLWGAQILPASSLSILTKATSAQSHSPWSGGGGWCVGVRVWFT